MEVKDKKVILTGAADGIGKELTKQLLNKGAFVYGLDINGEKLAKLKDELNTDRLVTYIVDVSSKENLINFKEQFIKDNGRVDILINNAGIVQPFLNIEDLQDDVISRVMNVNFYGPMNLCRLFIKDLINNEKGGFIVNVSSMAGFFPFPGQGIYGASKAALKIFTEGLYSELKSKNVGVMIVLPGAIETNILENSKVEYGTSKDGSSYKMTSASDAASQIIKGIEKNKFRIFVGGDSKFMNFIYKLNSKKAISFINKKMG